MKCCWHYFRVYTNLLLNSHRSHFSALSAFTLDISKWIIDSTFILGRKFNCNKIFLLLVLILTFKFFLHHFLRDDRFDTEYLLTHFGYSFSMIFGATLGMPSCYKCIASIICCFCSFFPKENDTTANELSQTKNEQTKLFPATVLSQTYSVNSVWSWNRIWI